MDGVLAGHARGSPAKAKQTRLCGCWRLGFRLLSSSALLFGTFSYFFLVAQSGIRLTFEVVRWVRVIMSRCSSLPSAEWIIPDLQQGAHSGALCSVSAVEMPWIHPASSVPICLCHAPPPSSRAGQCRMDLFPGCFSNCPRHELRERGMPMVL